MKAVVFVSGDSQEFDRYCKGRGLACSCTRESFSLKIGDDWVFVVKGFDKKDDCARVHFEKDVLLAFLRELENKMTAEVLSDTDGEKANLPVSDNRIVWDDIRLFVHWGGGYWADLEVLSRASLSACANGSNDNNFVKAVKSIFAVSSLRPKLIDVLANPICLPKNARELEKLIRRAECGCLSAYWTSCAVSGQMLPCKTNSDGFSVEFVKQHLYSMKRLTLESYLPIVKKDSWLESIRGLLMALDSVESKKVDTVDLSGSVHKFLCEMLDEEGHYV